MPFVWIRMFSTKQCRFCATINGGNAGKIRTTKKPSRFAKAYKFCWLYSYCVITLWPFASGPMPAVFTAYTLISITTLPGTLWNDTLRLVVTSTCTITLPAVISMASPLKFISASGGAAIKTKASLSFEVHDALIRPLVPFVAA